MGLPGQIPFPAAPQPANPWAGAFGNFNQPAQPQAQPTRRPTADRRESPGQDIRRARARQGPAGNQGGGVVAQNPKPMPFGGMMAGQGSQGQLPGGMGAFGPLPAGPQLPAPQPGSMPGQAGPVLADNPVQMPFPASPAQAALPNPFQSSSPGLDPVNLLGAKLGIF